MHSANHWGGALEIVGESQVDSTDDHRSQNADWDKASRKSYTLDETHKEVEFGNGCTGISCHRNADYYFQKFARGIIIGHCPLMIFTLALHKALLFFDAQKSGRLPKNNYSINWRGNSGLQDGNTTERGLVGGYYDAEYEGKYKAIDEYEHVRDLIKWGTDYLLLTFNSSAASVPYIYSQVGGSMNGSTVPDDHTCWTRPEDMDYPRPVQTSYAGPELAGEMAAALAAASIVFRDNNVYSEKLAKGAATVFEFGRDQSKRRTYSSQNPYIEHYYNSSGYYDEYMWGAAWLYYATGNRSYVSLATNQGLPSNAHAFSMNRDLNVLSWDNKLPAAMMLLTRLRIFLNPGYPYEAMLSSYHNKTGLTMCSYLQRYNVYNWTQGGLIQLNHGRGQPLQYVANAAFLASLFADYLNATGVPGWNCGPDFILTEDLRSFASSQINYILGANPMNMSYVVGYGNNYPKRVHHRGASIPNDNKKYSCRGGWKWYQSRNSNPNTIIGAMVGGPNKFDEYEDIRSDYSHGEPTVAGNAGLVAALVSLTTSGGQGIEKNIIFSAVPPLYPPSPPPPSPWKP
ncbi:Endoglucanase [Heracleum sosnowskyi]|uniref:Endoglucanase n=1 Tax=Heracleum sosnowskyi TaxID=360622 RepID=A0AAD8JAH3_9APIA|nr:Endoglucanase [Heracleum sosnowskyi]